MGIVGYALINKVKLNVLNNLNDNRFNSFVDIKTEMPVYNQPIFDTRVSNN